MEFYRSRHSDKRPKSRRRGDGPARSFRGSRKGRDSGFGGDGGGSATVQCAGCGTGCKVPFVPKQGRPVYCSDCFKRNRQGPGSEGTDKKSGFSRTSHPGGRNGGGSGTKPRNEKFLKKQQSFFSNGSDKFYETLKEKLFEILGGKVCSGCGFGDERALGFSNRNDAGTFDVIRRGGPASSWGKYISDPGLAREELTVLCLNCNEISRTASAPGKDRPRRKQSRYIPR